MSSPSVLSASMVTIPIYEGTVWQISTNHQPSYQFKLYSVINGRQLTYKLNIPTLEKARMCAEFLIHTANAKLNCSLLSMNTNLEVSSNKARISFHFQKAKDLTTFKSFCEVFSILERSDFSPEEPLEAADEETFLITYVHQEPPDKKINPHQFYRLIAAISNIFSNPIPTHVRSTFNKESQAQFTLEQSCVEMTSVELGSPSLASP